jgi:tRNA A-37 threonylcarbamoyl transferase component Bud32
MCDFRANSINTNFVNKGCSLDLYEWTKNDAEELWKAVVEIVQAIHSKGIAIMDLKPEHLILTPRGLFVIDYGCSYFVKMGRPIPLLLMSPMFSSVLDDTHFENPVRSV